MSQIPGSVGLWAYGVIAVVLLLAGCPGGGDDDSPGTPDAGFEPWTLEDPAPNGWQFVTDAFDVGPGEEIQRCYFTEVPDVNGDGSDVWIDQFKLALNPGSHHMNVFRVKTIIDLDGEPGTYVDGGPCLESSNWADWPLVVNNQNSRPGYPYTDWELPANVAARFSPGEKLMVQVHYVNTATQDTPFKARAGVNYYKSSATAPMELGTLFATQQSVRVCQSDPAPSYSGACSFGAEQPVKIIAANGHFHSRGKRFSMFGWDGQTTSPSAGSLFYESDEWDEPEMAVDLDVDVPALGGVFWTCDYRWVPPVEPITCQTLNEIDEEQANDCCYTFGVGVDIKEHCNVFVYYYPKSNDVFCN